VDEERGGGGAEQCVGSDAEVALSNAVSIPWQHHAAGQAEKGASVTRGTHTLCGCRSRGQKPFSSTLGRYTFLVDASPTRLGCVDCFLSGCCVDAMDVAATHTLICSTALMITSSSDLSTDDWLVSNLAISACTLAPCKRYFHLRDSS